MRTQVWKSSVYVFVVGWSVSFWLSAALSAPLAARKLRKNTWGSTESVFLVLNLFIPHLFIPQFLSSSTGLGFLFICFLGDDDAYILFAFYCMCIWNLFWILHESKHLWFSMWGSSHPLPPQLEIYGDICGCHNWWAGCYRLLVGRDHMGCWTSCGTQDRIPTTKNFLV